MVDNQASCLLMTILFHFFLSFGFFPKKNFFFINQIGKAKIGCPLSHLSVYISDSMMSFSFVEKHIGVPLWKELNSHNIFRTSGTMKVKSENEASSILYEWMFIYVGKVYSLYIPFLDSPFEGFKQMSCFPIYMLSFPL